jgi:hypothetical protein
MQLAIRNSIATPETNRLTYAQNMTEEEFAAIEKRIKWKLDTHHLASFWLIFTLNYLEGVTSTITPEQFTDWRYRITTLPQR